MNFPRVLHVGFNPIGNPTNTGLTLGSMFSDWPEEDLLQLYLRSRSTSSRRLSNEIVAPARVAPMDGLVRSVLGRRLPAALDDGLNNSVSRSTQKISMRSRLRVTATVANDIGPVWLPRPLLDKIREFDPLVIHSLLGGARVMRLVLKLSKRLDLPIVPHFMDDWAENIFADGQLLGVARRTVESTLGQILDRSPLLLTIGEDMQAEYQTRFNVPAVVVGNGVDVGEYTLLRTRRPTGATSTKTMRYVGGLHLGRADVVRTVGEALGARAESAGRWILELYVPPSDAERAKHLESTVTSIVHGGSTPPAEVPALLVAADALLFLESSMENIARFTRLSVSTKVPQYLAAGRPTLVLGPADQGSVRTLMRAGTTAVFAGSGGDRGEVARAVDSIDGLLGEGRPGVDPAWVSENFGVQATRARLHDALERAANGTA